MSANDPGPIPDSLKRAEPPKQEPPKQEPAKQEEEYQFHAIANIFPLMEGEEYGLFVDDIEKRGLQEPIVLYEGKILDGRNRYRACKELKLQPAVKQYTGNDPLGYVLSANFHRRHLNESQRAMVAARVVTTKLGDNQHIKREGRPVDLPTAAEMLNVSEKSVKRARDVCQKGEPQLQALVDRGKVAVSVAEKLVNNLTREKQAEALRAGEHGVRTAIKALAVPRSVKSVNPSDVAKRHIEEVWAPDELVAVVLEVRDTDYLKAVVMAALGKIHTDWIRELVARLTKVLTPQPPPAATVGATGIRRPI